MNRVIAKKIQDAKMKLFRKDMNLAFFGALLYKFELMIEKLSEDMEGFVKFNPKNLTKLIDGIIHLNEIYLEKNDYTSDNLIALIIHEILHILYKHGIRFGTREKMLWNVACDHVVDRDLKSYIQVIPYQGRYNIINRLHNELPKCSAEEAYNWLKKNQENNKIKLVIMKGKGSGSGSDQNNSGQPFEFDIIEFTDQTNGQKIKISGYLGGVDQSDPMNSEDKQKIELGTDNFVAEARATKDTLKDKGMIGGKLQELLDELLKVVIPWDTLLEKAIKKNVILIPDDRGWINLNKYFIPQGLTLPGTTFSESLEGVGILIIGVDTSGSISKTELKKFSTVIHDSMAYFRQIHLYTHDVEVHQKKIFDKENIQEFFDFIKNEGYKGRGGTSHQYVFQEVQNQWKDNDVKDELSMAIMLTDGYSDIEGIYKNYDWVKELPLVFLSTSDWEFPENNNYENIQTIKINNTED